MTKPLCGFPEREREAIAVRRAHNESLKGLGYWAATEYLQSKKKTISVKKKEKEDGEKVEK